MSKVIAPESVSDLIPGIYLLNVSSGSRTCQKYIAFHISAELTAQECLNQAVNGRDGFWSQNISFLSKGNIHPFLSLLSPYTKHISFLSLTPSGLYSR